MTDLLINSTNGFPILFSLNGFINDGEWRKAKADRNQSRPPSYMHLAAVQMVKSQLIPSHSYSDMHYGSVWKATGPQVCCRLWMVQYQSV